MCGIAGIAGPAARRDLAAAMARSLRHRGPDGTGFYEHEGIAFGHTRLKVIDLSTGDQPMSTADGRLTVVYNGEIYNFRELRHSLEGRGCQFRTQSDTEVLLHGYAEYGVGFLPRLEGIFAFALWDVPRRRLLLARDGFGVKPLHYRIDGPNLRFGSECKAILQDPSVPRRVDPQALHYFLNLRYIPGERTLFDGIRRLLPGEYLLFEGGKARRGRFFELADLAPAAVHHPAHRHGRRSQPEAYYLEGIRHYLQEAVRKQLVSDVPLGLYLSGGLDSSSLVACASSLGARPLRTFALGFNEPTDELADARIVADHFRTEHHEMSLDPEPLRRYPEVIWHVEEPKENILQGYLLAQFARQHVTVALSGLGGDELFAGYVNNRFIRPLDSLHRFVPSGLTQRVLAPLSRLAFRCQQASGRLELDEYRRGLQLLLSAGDPQRYYLILRNVWDHDRGMVEEIYGPALRAAALSPTDRAFHGYFGGGHGALGQALWAEMNTKLVDDFLLNDDRTSMAHGLEVRVPFLDRDLVRFALEIPPTMLMRRNQTKTLFRDAMTPWLPEHALRKKKWGFSFNPYYQFQKDLKSVAEGVLTRERVEARGWFRYEYLCRILDHPPHPRLRWHYFFLWLAVGLEIWARMFLEGDVAAPDLRLEAYVDKPRSPR